MVTRALTLLLLCSTLVAFKPSKIVGDGAAENADIGVKATVYVDGESVQQVIGSTLDGHYIVFQLWLTPKDKFTVDLDNFMLRTDKDGERSHPFKPTQIAGDGALVISDGTGGEDDPKRKNSKGPTWSGMGVGVGRSGVPSPNSGSKATMQEATGKRNPVLDSLTQKMLEEKETDEPVSGFLYFPMEKQRLKDLELIVTTPSGKLNIRFK